jgi:tRNA threonylcarbamoyladenosine biosynthesis protein TsaE
LDETIIIKDEQAMARYAEQCARQCSQHAHINEIFALTGPMGAGKSFFARHFIRHLCGNDIDVPSPTFTLLQQYDAPNIPIWHFDLYRLENAEDIYEIGWEEAMHEGICLIEWPERLAGLLPPKRHDILFELTGLESRKLTYNFYG